MSQVTNDFATCAHAQEMAVGETVALSVRVLRWEEKYTKQSGNPYLEVYGVDMNKSAVGPLRLWDHEEGDLAEGNTYILRGLKVNFGTYWDDSANRYIPNVHGRLTVECTNRAAAEDV